MTLRSRLALGYALVFLMVLAAMGAALFAIVERALLDQIDSELRERGMQVERAIIIRGDIGLNAANLSADIFALSPPTASQELSSPGIHIRIVDTEGRSLAVSSPIAAQIPIDISAVGTAAQGRTVFRTLTIGDADVRVLYRPLDVGDSTLAVIQVSESLSPTATTLRELRGLLIAGGGVALIVGLLGGWLFTRQALRPVDQLTAQVARIAATGQFTERVPEMPTGDEISKLGATFNDLLDRIHLMLDRQRTLVADTSHELRNPLMVVRGNVELLAHELASTERREASAEAIEEVDRMTRLIQDLLFLADADADTAIVHEDVPLESIVASIYDDARLVAVREDGARHVVLAANDPLIVRGDQERLRQLIWNLVENAIRYTPSGGTVTISLRRHGPVAELTVADTGIGIPPEHLPHIFDRFYRVDTGRSRKLGGTGLGLSIVRQIAEAHHGQVRVRSTADEGSTFTVALPVVEY